MLLLTKIIYKFSSCISFPVQCLYNQDSEIGAITLCFASTLNWLPIQIEFICLGKQNSFHEIGFMPYRASLGLFCHLLNSITSGIGINGRDPFLVLCFKVEH